MAEDLCARTKAFSLRVIRLVKSLPRDVVAQEIGRQLLRSGMSVGANYRAAQRGRSKREFIAKLGIALEEADESCYWLELLIEAQVLPETRLADLLGEADQLTAILTAAIKNARGKAT